MLSVVKMLLKREVGGRAFNSHEVTLLIMENHGKIMELCFSISVGTLFLYRLHSFSYSYIRHRGVYWFSARVLDLRLTGH